MGKLLSDPERRTAANGKHFTTARLSASIGGDESVLCSVIAFAAVAEQLSALAKGDTVAITGRCTPKAWLGKDGTPKAGLDIVADALLSVYHLRRKRQAMEPRGADEEDAGGRR
ncbi:MAG TPA: single-stranded DNA-binding protein [Rubrivivax sp.]|nr:single-stranded DNA-binding protein [Rubrivivax sp.]